MALPTGGSAQRNLWDVAADLSRRLVAIFLPDADGRRPVDGDRALFSSPEWAEHLVFPEYFLGHRRRPGGQPPDGLERPGRQADQPERLARVGPGLR